MLKHLNYLLVLILFSLIGMKALFHPGLYTAHDVWHQVVRFYYYSEAVNNGQFPPNWISLLANNFGYPLFYFSYHLPWMLGTFLLKLNLNFYDSLKGLFFLSYLFSGFTMYLFVYVLLKDRLAAFISSFLYLWLPYHFLVILVGASIGVSFVFVFAPLVFLGIYLINNQSKYGIPVFSIALSGIILSHIMHIIFLLPIVFLFFLYQSIISSNRFLFIKNTFLGILLTILLTAFYLIPAFYYSKFTRFFNESGFQDLYKRNFISLYQIIYSKWGVSPIVNNAKDAEISFQLGIAQWISIFLLVIISFFKQTKKFLKLNIFLLTSFIVCIFLMLDISQFIWSLVVKVVSVDFPFRFLLPASFIASFCSGVVIASFRNKGKMILAIFLILIALYTNRNHLRVNEYTNYPISTYLESPISITTNTYNEYLPLKADSRLLQQPWNEADGENISISNTIKLTNSLTFDLDLSNNQKVALGQFYFPGQTVFVDAEKKDFDIDQEGRISLEIPKGTHKIKVEYKSTTLTNFSKLLSILGILITLILIFKVNLSKKFALN